MSRLTGRIFDDRRGLIAVALGGLIITLSAAVVATDPQTVGPTLLMPWLALLAFALGPRAGLAAGLASFGLYLAAASGDGLDITPQFVLGRMASFALIGLGVGLAGKKLRASERRSRRLVEGLPLVMYTEDGNALTYISPQIESLLGYPTAAWASESNLWRRALHPDDRDRVLAAYEAAVAERAPFEADYRLVAADGRTVWVRDSSASVTDGRRSYRQGFIVDVTQQKNGETKLKRNATLMRGLVDGTVDGIALTDRAGELAIANEPMLRFALELGLPMDGPIHERLLAIADSVVDRERFVRRMRELAASPELESFDEVALRDSERVFQGFTRPVIGEDGEFLGRVWTLREVTEARQVDRIKDALIANVSHELRTPLTSIIGYLELVGSGDGSLSEQDAQFVEIARRNAARLQHMVEELLFVGRVDADGLSLGLAEVDVATVAQGALASALPVAQAKDINLHFQGDSAAFASADATRLGQVFDNLLSNAIKFTPPGGSVTVSVRRDGDSVVAIVADTGCGIPRSEQERLFERFFRSSATAHLPGTGLGLTIVRAIVESHGGSITCSSDEGVGTTFTLGIPLQAEDVQSQPAAAEDPVLA